MGKGKWWGSISHAPFLLTMAPQLWPCWGFLTRKLTGVGGTRKGPWDPKPLSGGDFDISSTPPPAFLFQASTIRIKESFVLKMPMGGGWEASVNQHVYYSSLRATCYPGPQTGILEQAGSLGRRH